MRAPPPTFGEGRCEDRPSTTSHHGVDAAGFGTAAALRAPAISPPPPAIAGSGLFRSASRRHLRPSPRLRTTGRAVALRHRVDAAGFGGLLHERHRGGQVQVLELVEVDATAAGLRTGLLRMSAGVPSPRASPYSFVIARPACGPWQSSSSRPALVSPKLFERRRITAGRFVCICLTH